jgi:pimeloyl-ACP methyl ester carboxylesterase
MKLPIIYVRGFAGGTAGIDRATDDPFYGFNEGSVNVRVGGDSQAHFHQFESPLLRLILDDGYELFVRGSQRAYLDSRPDKSLPPASIWVHRFYDVSASTLGRRPDEFVLERAAEDLFAFVRLVQAKTGAERVHLVAHSMGGLICRSMIQRVIPQLTGRRDGAVDYVQRLFTYGTPHGGIEFSVGFGLVEKLRDVLDINGAEIFGPERMYRYLTADLPYAPRAAEAPPGWRAEEMPADGFPTDRVFCLVGTNAEDYGVARGLSAKAVGARSDGLVQIENAYVPGAHRAFVHRSHSGRYGMVNSEEGYQNLRRFLFGDLRVDVELINLNVRGAADDEIVWQLETQLAIRGLPVLLHEQSTAHHCPIQVEWQRTEDSPETPLPLLTTFLCSDARPETGSDVSQRLVRYALRLRLISVRQRDGAFRFADHLEQTADFDDTLVVDIAPGGEHGTPRASATWNSLIPGAIRDWEPAGESLDDTDPAAGVWRGCVKVPPSGRPILGPNAAISITVTAR